MTTIADLQAKVAALGALAKDAAPDVADALETAVRRQIGAGETPDGQQWPPTQEGEQPLKTAANALRVAAIGGVVYVRLVGHIARHNNARARGGIERLILPKAGVPRRYERAIAQAVTRRFEAAK